MVRQSFWTNANFAVNMVGGMASASLCARILGLKGFGVLAVIAAGTGLIYGLAAIGDTGVVTTFVTRGTVQARSDEAARVFRFALAVALGTALIAYAVIAVFVFTVKGLLNIDQAHAGVVLLYSACGVLTAMNGQLQATLRLADRLQLRFVVILATRATAIGLLTATWLTGGGLTEVVSAHVAASAVSGLGMFASVAVSAPRAGLAGFLRSASIKVPPDVARFQFGALCNSSLTALANHVDVIMLSQFTGAADIGLYNAAKRTTETARPLVGSIAHSSVPEWSRQWYSGQGTELRHAVLRVTILATASAAVLFGTLAVLREPIIRLFLGEEFVDAASLLPIMILGTLPVAAAFRMLPQAIGRIWPSMLSGTAGLAFLLPALLWLIPRYGITGAAWAKAIHAMVCLLVIIPFVVLAMRQSRQLPEPAPGKKPEPTPPLKPEPTPPLKPEHTPPLKPESAQTILRVRDPS